MRILESSEGVRRRYPGETGLVGVLVVVLVGNGEVEGDMTKPPDEPSLIYKKD